MAGIFGGVVSIIDWLKDKLPICDRKERWKNEIDNLKKERNGILKKPASIKAADRLIAIDNLIEQRVQWLKNTSN